MIQNPQSIVLLRSPWTEHLSNLLSLVDENLLVVCPFLKRSGTNQIFAEFDRRSIQESVSITLITDLKPESVLAGTLDIDALTELGRGVPNLQVTHLPSVHAKVYVADCKKAIVTSGNLTRSGLQRNVEYGIALREEKIVREIRSDFEGYAMLGASISHDDLVALSLEMHDLKETFQRAQSSIRAQARRAFEARLESARTQLLRHRAKGTTTHAIFADSIMFLLRNGPLMTSELQPLIQSLHPDLCDDSVDRVIDGVNFGKRWKHYVRNAQQHLKRNGEVLFDKGRWCLLH